MTHMGLEYLKHQESSRHNLETESHARNQLAWDRDIGTKRLSLDTNKFAWDRQMGMQRHLLDVQNYQLAVNRAKQDVTEYAHQVVGYINTAAKKGDEEAYQAGLDVLDQLSGMYQGLDFREAYDDKTWLESSRHTNDRILGALGWSSDWIHELQGDNNRMLDDTLYPVDRITRTAGNVINVADSAGFDLKSLLG